MHLQRRDSHRLAWNRFRPTVNLEWTESHLHHEHHLQAIGVQQFSGWLQLVLDAVGGEGGPFHAIRPNDGFLRPSSGTVQASLRRLKCSNVLEPSHRCSIHSQTMCNMIHLSIRDIPSRWNLQPLCNSQFQRRSNSDDSIELSARALSFFEKPTYTSHTLPCHSCSFLGRLDAQPRVADVSVRYPLKSPTVAVLPLDLLQSKHPMLFHF